MTSKKTFPFIMYRSRTTTPFPPPANFFKNLSPKMTLFATSYSQHCDLLSNQFLTLQFYSFKSNQYIFIAFVLDKSVTPSKELNQKFCKD
ncbi:hypothetical protein HanIR_Chr02g0067951 [Helianthus annuus]|nr:hypothetical protein HanIR_Chr02g0067951 [Helianthus annuus]